MTEDPTAQTLRETYAVPAAVGLAVEGSRVLAWRPGAEEAVRRVAADPGSLAPAGVVGRAPLARLDDPKGPVLVRPYRKGGLLRALRGARFRGRWRPLDELVIHHDLAEAGAPVAEALGCVIRRGPGGWSGELLVREVVGAVDLEAWLYGADPEADATIDGAAPRPEVILGRAGRAVRSLHDAGVEHADLHPKNVLLTPAGAVLVIDLDNARRHAGALGDDERLDNLARFQRAIVKHARRGMPSTRWSATAFLEGYTDDLEAAAALREQVAERMGGLTLRKLWWSLTGATRQTPEEVRS